MANGYGGSSSSSSSSGSTGSSGSSGSYSQGQGFSGGFVKTKNGVEAPLGFHYMPNGKLMNDADHIAKFGYIKRTISGVDIDYEDITPNGGSKLIVINGDAGFVFSMEIYEGARASYYNFKTNTWSAANYKLTNVQANSGSYNQRVSFPVESSLKTYTINVYAETVENIKTLHSTASVVRNKDGIVSLNESTGSDSNVLTKTLYQDVLKNLYLSAIDFRHGEYTDTINGDVSGSNRVIIDGDATDTSLIRIGDRISGTGIAASVHALVTKINPDGDNVHEFEISVADSIGDGAEITFTSPFTAMTPHYTDSNTGRAALEVPSTGSKTLNFSITLNASVGGRAFRVNRLPTAEDLCFVNTVTIGSAGLAIPGEDVSARNIRGEVTVAFYRWPVDNVAGLSNGMALDPGNSGSGLNTLPANISDYKTTTTLQEIKKSRYNQEAVDYTVPDVFAPGVDTAGNAITSSDRNGRVTAQAGNITFSVQQPDALKSDSEVRIIAQGVEAIKTATGMNVSLSNVVITPGQVKLTTSAASSASTTIALDNVGGAVVGAVVRGVGISAALANPTVVSKSVATGAGNIVVSSAQTLEDGTTLFIDDFGGKLDLTGTINVSNMPISDTTLYFSVERFLTAL